VGCPLLILFLRVINACGAHTAVRSFFAASLYRRLADAMDLLRLGYAPLDETSTRRFFGRPDLLPIHIKVNPKIKVEVMDPALAKLVHVVPIGLVQVTDFGTDLISLYVFYKGHLYSSMCSFVSAPPPSSCRRAFHG
jgi:hypothetical protein